MFKIRCLGLGACLTVLLLVLSGAALWAQEDVGELQAQYEQRKLTILPEQGAPASLGWSAMLGFKRIDEPTLLQVAGYEAESQASRRHLTMFNALNFACLGATVVGLLLEMDGIFVPMILYPGTFRMNFTEMYVGLGVMGAGFMAWMFVLTIPVNTQPRGRIDQIARDYNDALIDTINAELKSKGK
jgi:hypothetical protein